MAVAIVVATYLGLNPPGFAAQTVALAFGLAAASIFPALMMGIFSTRINNTGAVAGMLAGLVVTLVYIFLHKGWLFIPGTNSFTDADPLLGPIKSTSFGAIGAMVNFACGLRGGRHDQGNSAGDQRSGRKRAHSRVVPAWLRITESPLRSAALVFDRIFRLTVPAWHTTGRDFFHQASENVNAPVS